MTNPLVSLSHAHKSFGKTEVLKDISLSVEQGQVVAIIGPSGGGKSTLLRCMTLLETLDGGSLSYGDLAVATDGGSGSVYGGKSVLSQAKTRFGLVFQNFNLFPHCTLLETLDGGRLAYGDLVVAEEDADGRAVYAGKTALKEAKTRFGLVFQNFNLFPHYTVLKNITDAPLSVQKRPKDQVMAQAHELLVKMGLEGKENMVPCELSGGQQQRVAIARALALNPDVLFFDEPTSALDPELTKGVLKVIRDLADEHMTMVIVTHEMSFARDVADHIIFMDGGYIVEEGPAEQVINNPQQERTKLFLANYGD